MTAPKLENDRAETAGAGTLAPTLIAPRALATSPVATTEIADRLSENALGDVVLQDLVDEAPDGQIVVDGHGRMVRVNAQLESLFGYDPGELLGQPVEVLLPVRSRPAHVESRDTFASHPTLRSMGSGLELLGRQRDGTEIAVDIQLSPLPTKAGTWVIATVRDDTNRRVAEGHRQLVVIAGEDQPIALELGDTVIHRLFGTGLRLQSVLSLADGKVHDELGEIVTEIDGIIREIRSIIYDLNVGRANHGATNRPPPPRLS